MSMIRIMDIQWINTDEADLILSDGHQIVVCYSYPCKYKIGDSIDGNILYCHDPIYIYKCDEEECTIKCINRPYSFKIIGRLIDKKKGIIKCNKYHFEIDDILIPKDIKENNMIEFACEKIDLF